MNKIANFLLFTTILFMVSCSTAWSESNEREFMKACQDFTADKEMSDSLRTDYCYCLLDKYQEEYKEQEWKGADRAFVLKTDSACLGEIGYDFPENEVIIRSTY